MGADIHLRVEQRKDGEWQPVEQMVKNQYYTKESAEWEKEYVVESWYHGRNYQLFGVLADVRNYGDVVPICQPKGFPKDASDAVREDYEGWGVDAHSASYFTLAELNKYHYKHDLRNISEEFFAMMQRMEKMVYPEGLVAKKTAVKKPAVNPLAQKTERSALLTQVKIPESNETDIRIVFWFDN